MNGFDPGRMKDGNSSAPIASNPSGANSTPLRLLTTVLIPEKVLMKRLLLPLLDLSSSLDLTLAISKLS